MQGPYKIALLMIVVATALQCSPLISKSTLSKIEFDYSAIDAEGLDRGEAAVDYEFCIPAQDLYWNEILQIEDQAKCMKSSRGRIGCTGQQWLCIISTRNAQWKERLFSIASLPYIDKIIRTYYE